MHAFRIALRMRCLEAVQARRWDAEGSDDIDMEASSDAEWKKWQGSLAKRQQMQLAVFRGGAISTQTRRTRFADGVLCCFCGAHQPSARHLLAQCPRFAAPRAELQAEHTVPRVFWTSCPRVALKSGWIAFSVSTNPASRVALKIAAAKLGIIIMTELEPHLSNPWQ